MNIKIKKIYANINFIRSIPSIICFSMSKNKIKIKEDIDRWIKIQELEKLNLCTIMKLNWLLVFNPEFRNYFYYRIGGIKGRVLNIFYPKLSTLYICTSKIGTGLFLMHGFSTIITAKEIGSNCIINQQVTIGYRNNETPPTIGNNVRIGANATVIGDVIIGNNVSIGAGAVITKNIPDNCVVVGNPAKIIKQNGRRVNIELNT